MPLTFKEKRRYELRDYEQRKSKERGAIHVPLTFKEKRRYELRDYERRKSKEKRCNSRASYVQRKEAL